MRWSKITDCGPVRLKNEDALCVCPELGLFAVADGMGGYKAGEIASRLALQTLENYCRQQQTGNSKPSALLREAVAAANQAVYREARQNPQRRGMGTTITACLLNGRELLVANVGDSRALLLRDGRLTKLTSDHSLVQELIDGGGITEADAFKHPRRNVLTRALGVAPLVETDVFDYQLIAGDRVLLCTDGLSAFVEEKRLEELMGWSDDPEATVKLLLDEAIRAGSNDNVTIICMVVD
ncbi:MAG: Stp1/IreP family PP2C-type Ser/Thr phosphatase [Firmicutes bacterium]|nr:Stp1/IreP family PP2C-type Ser/Thr phosphatase [Bacillota bacterium]